MTPLKHSDLLSSGAGLASSIAIETRGELGETAAVKARGYWEQVWLRFVDEPLLRGFGAGHQAACHYPLERWPMTAGEVRQGDEPMLVRDVVER